MNRVHHFGKQIRAVKLNIVKRYGYPIISRGLNVIHRNLLYNYQVFNLKLVSFIYRSESSKLETSPFCIGIALLIAVANPSGVSQAIEYPDLTLAYECFMSVLAGTDSE